MRMLKKILASVLLSMSMAAYAADIPVDAKLDYNQEILMTTRLYISLLISVPN